MGSYLDVGPTTLWYEDGTGSRWSSCMGLETGGSSTTTSPHSPTVPGVPGGPAGHGRSPDPPGPLGPAQFTDDLVAFLEKAVGAKATLAGYSVGATTALLTAVARPDLVDRLVLISGVFHRDGWLMPPSTEGGVPPVLAQLYAEVTPHEPDHIEVVLGKLAEAARTEPALTPTDLSAVHCRTMVMAADDDLVDVQHTLALYQALPNAELTIVPGTSHNLLLEKPELCTRLVREFLTNPPVPTTIPIRRRPPHHSPGR